MMNAEISNYEPEDHGWRASYGCDEWTGHWEREVEGGLIAEIGRDEMSQDRRCWASVWFRLEGVGAIYAESWACRTIEDAVRITELEATRIRPLLDLLKSMGSAPELQQIREICQSMERTVAERTAAA